MHGLRRTAATRTTSRRRSGRAEIVSAGEFRTAPAPSDPQTIRFAVSGDADGTHRPEDAASPRYNVFQVYGRMAAERNHFNINLGDTIYSDSEVGGVPPALTVPAKWAKYRQNLGFGHLRNLRRGTGLYSHWDDHEFINDFSRAEHGAADLPRRRGRLQGLRTRHVHAASGLYRTFRWGKHLELFFLDERSFRSAKVRTACGNDLAPTAPQAVRNAFAALVPALANPGAAGLPRRDQRSRAGRCSARASTRRSRRAIRASTATWKVVVNEVPIQQFYALPVRPLGGLRGRARASCSASCRRT